MIRTILIFFIAILFVSYGAPPEDKFKGVWLDNGEPEVLIHEIHGELFLTYGKGEFKASVEDNNMTCSIASQFGQLTLELKYLDETDRLLYQPIGGDKFKELDRYYLQDLDKLVGLWKTERSGSYMTTLEIVLEDNEYKVKRTSYYRDSKNSENDSKLFVKDGILYENTESFKNIRLIKVNGDTLTYNFSKYIKSM